MTSMEPNTAFIPTVLEKISQQQDHSRIIIRDYSQVVADLVGLYQEVIELQGMSRDITNSIQDLVASLREQG